MEDDKNLSHKEEINGRNSEFHGPSSFSTAPFKKVAAVTVSLISIILFMEAYFSSPWASTINLSDLSGDSFKKLWSYNSSAKLPNKKIIEYTLNCSSSDQENMRQTCPVSGPTSTTFEEGMDSSSSGSSSTCPDYFRWIYEDLRPWMEIGISRELVEAARPGAFIRIIVVDGKVYMEKYKGVYTPRDVFTIWGILQLLRLYPGKLPDFDMMFNCGDKTAMWKRYFRGPNAIPQPLFHYCGDDDTYDIVFPDWSFWGWPELRIKPWNSLKDDLKEGNNRSKWIDREPYAYWKGNIHLGWARKQLSKCIKTHRQDWNARIYDLNWSVETQNGFNTSDLASQCTHRYKIYAEGISWSVSEKYILACDSVALLANPHYYDFFTRSLQPMVHYWPLNFGDLCRSIKFATDWCNNHTEKAQQIGKTASSLVQENLKMKYVYDYMFHLLSMYAKLLKYKPTVPPGAVEFCPENMACHVEGLDKDYMIKSMVASSSDTGPCFMPPPFSSAELKDVVEKKEHVMKQVEAWEESGSVAEETIENVLKGK